MGLVRKGLVAAGYGVAAAALVAGIAWGAGNYSNWPIVASPSYCAAIIGSGPTQLGTTGQGAGTTTTGAPSTYCAQTVPAGPPSLTGAEVVPIDTRIAGGPIQSALLTMQELGIGYTYQQLTASGQTVAVPNTSIFLVDPTGSLSTLTLTLPQSPLDGQFLRLAFTANVTTLVVSSGAQGATVKNSPTAVTTSTTGAYNYELMYSANLNTWYRLQ